MTSKFSVHGHCQITVEQNIIIVEAEGPWNIEFFHQLHLDLRKTAQSTDYNSFSILLVLAGEGLSVEEAIDFHVEFLIKSSVKAIAINLKDCITPASTKAFCQKIYFAADIEHKFFDDNATAIKWLNEKMTMSV